MDDRDSKDDAFLLHIRLDGAWRDVTVDSIKRIVLIKILNGIKVYV